MFPGEYSVNYCRPEEGVHKCRAVRPLHRFEVGDEVCVDRTLAYYFCGVTLKCTDDEVLCGKR